MNALDQINSYPFWGPANAGPAGRFAAPYWMIGPTIERREAAIQTENRVPQETQYSNSNVPVFQVVPAYVPLPQAPVQSVDPFAQSRSLLDYARTTLGSSQMGTADNRGA